MTLKVRNPFKLYPGLYPLDLCCVIFTDNYKKRKFLFLFCAEKHNLQIGKTQQDFSFLVAFFLLLTFIRETYN